MLKLATLVLKNIGRNSTRSILTSMAIVMLTLIFMIVTTVTSTARQIVNKQASESKLIVSERWTMPSHIPMRDVEEIVSWPQVIDWTTWNFYGGYFDDSGRQDRLALGIATRTDNLRSMHEDLRDMPGQVFQELRDTKSGALIGEAIASTMSWRAGDEFTMVSTTHPGKNLRFKIVGILPGASWARVVLFDRNYFTESTGEDIVNSILVRVPGPTEGDEFSDGIAHRFRDRRLQLKVETEAAGVARFVGRSQALLSIIDLVVAILLIDMVLVLGNSISIAVRERRKEFAVLKCLGFGPSHIFFLVVAEAAILGGFSGWLGATIAYVISSQTASGTIPSTAATEFLLTFPVQPSAMAWGVAIGFLTGLASSLSPAINALRIKVVDVFSRL